jgi:hypothetical protein
MLTKILIVACCYFLLAVGLRVSVHAPRSPNSANFTTKQTGKDYEYE